MNESSYDVKLLALLRNIVAELDALRREILFQALTKYGE